MSTHEADSPSNQAAGGDEQAKVRRLANALRALSMDAVEAAKSGHPGMPMGMADVATVLFGRFLKFDPAQPDWPDRDRFVLSAGHGSMLLYSLLYLTGYPRHYAGRHQEFPQDRQSLRRPSRIRPYSRHRDHHRSAGPGHRHAVGMALAERILDAPFGDGLVDHKTYVIASDGDLMEGVSHEAISLAGHLELSKLIVLYDDNSITIDGSTSISDSTERSNASRPPAGTPSASTATTRPTWRARSPGRRTSDKPALIACKTIIGFGLPTRAGTQKAHSDAPGAEEIAGARKTLNWPYEPFVIPDDIAADWRAIGARGEGAHEAWRNASAKRRRPLSRHSMRRCPATFRPRP